MPGGRLETWRQPWAAGLPAGRSLFHDPVMALEFQKRVVDLVRTCLGASLGDTPDWLVRPGRAECRAGWEQVQRIYGVLTGLDLPQVMRPVERRKVDPVLMVGKTRRILEVDERQHFNRFRAATFDHYTSDNPVAFEIKDWLDLSLARNELEGGGFARPMPPLFPAPNGRHAQRAFRDALCDLLPPLHGYAPTLRIGEHEARSWVSRPDADARMHGLLSKRLA